MTNEEIKGIAKAISENDDLDSEFMSCLMDVIFPSHIWGELTDEQIRVRNDFCGACGFGPIG